MDNPLPMQYLGSKSRIAGWIMQEIARALPGSGPFCDLFSGSGVMALAAADAGYRVAANDVQHYSSAVLASQLTLSRHGLKALARRVEALTDAELLGDHGRQDAAPWLAREDALFADQSGPWRHYRDFCRETPIIAGTCQETAALRDAAANDLFWRYYANTYFGVRQCLELDALAELAATLPAARRGHLVAATLSVMTFLVSSTTHLAQFLKPSSERTVANLVRRRRRSFLPDVAARLRALAAFPLPCQAAQVTRADWTEALDRAGVGDGWVVYVDPPYFKEHYSRYYHVLDTFALYDYPDLTPNPRLGTVTVGRYRAGRTVSPFGLRARVGEAFASLLARCRERGARVALSYANTSLVGRDELVSRAGDAGYHVTEAVHELMHSGQGQPRNRTVLEYLFLME